LEKSLKLQLYYNYVAVTILRVRLLLAQTMWRRFYNE